MKKTLGLFHIDFKPEKRVLGLDIFRAISIFLVLKVHANLILQQYWPKLGAAIGISGPELFFVLSGYLIGQIFMTRISSQSDFGVSDVWQFIRRRWFRTLPNYYLFLGFHFIILVTIQNQFRWSLLSYFVFAQNLFHSIPDFFLESWSLTIEEWFYLSMPFWIYFFYKTLRLKDFSKPILAYLLIILLVRISTYYVLRADHTPLQMLRYSRDAAIIRVDSIMLGVLAAYLKIYCSKPWFRYRVSLLIGGIFLIYVVYFTKEYQSLFFKFNFRFIIQSAGAAMLLSFFDSIRKASRVWAYLFTHISLVSYSMYLINMPLMNFIFRPLLGQNVVAPWLLYLLFILSTILLSTLIYKYFEKPVMDLRDGNSINLRKLRLNFWK